MFISLSFRVVLTRRFEESPLICPCRRRSVLIIDFDESLSLSLSLSHPRFPSPFCLALFAKEHPPFLPHPPPLSAPDAYGFLAKSVVCLETRTLIPYGVDGCGGVAIDGHLYNIVSLCGWVWNPDLRGLLF